MSLATWVVLYGILAWLAACVAILAVAGAIAWIVAQGLARYEAWREPDAALEYARQKRKAKG